MSLLPELKNISDFDSTRFRTYGAGAVVHVRPHPVPPLAEQQRIVAKVDELMRWCDALEARLIAARDLGAKVLNSLIHHTLNP